ncbi:redoxin domain-containing protein [Kordia sp. YSTF-M3]|uniref:Redoxin domain-containing protein n=1 Tax=Kordia aestuariivivens TaxID=2759037 RepID=A0ABR7Q5A9_9FLAO|nr:redoxin domain-containing protein [Kordia aestuariivivens]MBC8753638.1 redoxin domain-containing protein [Kordia aestuariivivens]
MLQKSILIVICIVFFSCKNEPKSTAITEAKDAETSSTNVEIAEETTSDIPVLNFEQFEKYLNIEDDNIHVVNFWATWCAPCVKELPHFEAVNRDYKDKNVKVLLVSLDFNLKKLNSFLAKNELKSEKVLLDDPDQNAWISKVSEKWSGAIPATVIYKKGKRKFYEHSFTKAELESELRNFIN